MELEYIDNNFTATIDNQTEHINVYKIIKKPTQFILNQSIDTILEQPINVNASLQYLEDEEFKSIQKGFVEIQITDLQQQRTYYNNIVHFYDGTIITKIQNTLSIGSYLLKIQYKGSQIYEEQTLTVQFEINKKNARCIIEKTSYEQYPDQPLSINVQLISAENNQPLSNCIINYSFNEYQYIAQTDKDGFATLTITMPSVTNSTEDITYPLEINIENDFYILTSKIMMNIAFKKYKTSTIYTATYVNNEAILTGNVYAYADDEELVNVGYGNINFEISDSDNVTTYPINDNGYFSINKTITQTANANVSPSQMICSTPQTTNIKIELLNGTIITRNYVEKHNIQFKATVTSQNKIVPYGMVTFIIMQNYNEIYRYVTELDNNGEAFFYFDVSTVGKYQIKAQYHPIFEYQESQTKIQTYEIINEQ